MLNIEHRNDQLIFHIDGNDQRTSRIASLLPLVAIVGTIALHVWVIEPKFSDYVVWLLAAEILANIILVGGFLRWLSSGKISRYAVCIDMQEKIIAAQDKKLNQQMWETDFHMKNLYLSEIRVFIGQESYAYPALVYGEVQRPIVEASVPYPEHSVLCFGKSEALNEIMSTFKKQRA